MTNDQISVALTLFCCLAPYTAGIITVVMVNRLRRRLSSGFAEVGLVGRIKEIWNRYIDWMNEEK